jgi:hypothetical protein
VDTEKQKQIITENYAQNPKNLFARCNYARLCLAENNPEAREIIIALQDWLKE